MNKIIIISIILVVGLSIQTDNQCDCSQLLIPQDCQANQSLNCSWDLEKLACITKSITPTVKSNSSYCDNLKQEKCQQEQYCTWYKNSCVPFSSCTAFALTTQEECKTVNVQCTTNGVHCVKIDQCSTYTKQPSCFKNSQMKFCYWNSENKLCEDADTCEKLPASLKSDMECRSALQFCTMKLNGGCEKSPEKCSDHKLESQCAWNLDKSQQCYWNNQSNQCVDRICLNAPTTAITDSYCKTFLSDGSCTVKKGGGCRVRTTCEEADVEDSCKKNKDGQDCFWNESNCLLKICSNALITLTTNDQCNQFIQGCITKPGGGCVENGECIVATIKEACVKNIRGQECFWNSEKNKCLDLKCSNAPFSLTTHDECTTFLSTCTKKVGGGCEDRNCSNAPNTLDSNTLCEEYYPNNKCITKKDGGCIINTICSDIQISQACDKDANNKQCFWDDDNQQCKDKICVNAPTSYNTHDMCQQFLNECTVNKTNDGCVNKTCENSLTQEICDKDLNNQLCTWKGQCYKKQCSYASQTIITNDECFSYSSDCILHNDGYGCTEIVMKCDEILIKEACKFILKVTNGVKSYPECDWKNSQCQNKTCLTAPNTINTTILCDSYLKDCVASNPVSGQIKGCQDLPRNCDQRKSSENCKITRENYPDCIWDNTNGQCLQKSCLTANVQGDNESVTTFTFASCKGYLSQCIPNSTLPNANGCMDQPQSCNGLTVNNCKDEAKINGDCYWNNNVCNDKKCENLGLKTHAACSGELDTCTVTADQQNCMTLANDCSEYSIEDQCKYIVNNDNCIWTNNQCRNSICSDTKNSDQFDSDDECSNFLVKNDKCTVLDRVTNGCIPKQNSCNLYTIQSQCYSTITGGICIWINNTCKSKSLYATGECSTFTGTQSDCELYRLGCTNDSNAVSSTPCILDCTKYQKASLKLSDCNGFHQSCSVNSEGNKCVKNEALCSSYKNSSDCYKASDGYCVYVNSSCKNIATIADCQDVIQSNLDDAKCKVFNQLCTVNKDQDKCQEEKATCDLYDAELNCTISTAQPCIWNVDKYIINAKEYDLCSKVVGEVGTITRSYCSSIDSTCIGNSDASGCQPIKDNCSDYLTQQSCSYSSNDYHCIWSNDTCIKPNDPATDCAAITQYQILANSCSAILTGCIGTTLNTKCHQKQSTCSLYQTQETCTRSEESQPICFWDTSSETPSCKSFSAAADCEIITTDSYSQDICTGYSDLCVVGKGKCQVNKPDCSDYDNQDSCTFSGRIKCFWNQNECQHIRMSCDIIQGTNLRNQCEKYNTSCIHRQDGNSCQLKQSQCSSYVSENDCTIATNDQKCVWNSSCVQFTQSSQCSLIKGVNLTNEDCQSYNTNCTVKASKTGCQLAQSQCSSYSTSDQCTFITGNTKCYWNVNTCILITGSTNNCDQIVLSPYSKEGCEKYTSCTSDQNNTKCIQKQALCSQGSICGMSADEGNCVLVDSVCVKVDNTKCKQIKGTYTKDYCTKYHNGCTVTKARDGCIKLESLCSTYQSPNDCVTDNSSQGCIYQSSSCQLAANCDLIKPDQMAPINLENCKLFNCVHTTYAGNISCQNKQPCVNYSHTDYCTYDNNYNKCYWDGTVCKSYQGSDCSLMAGGGKSHTLYNQESSNCTSNKLGSACQELKSKCRDYGSESECTYSKDEGLCLYSEGQSQCTQLGSGTSCSQRSSLVSKDCHLLSTVCAPKGDGTGCQEKQNRCGYYTSQNDCSLSLFDGWCFWNTKVTPNKCDFVSGISDCTYITGTGLTNDDCQKYNAKCFVNNKGTSCYAQLASCSVNIQDNCNYSENEKGCYWNSGSCKPVTQCSDINSRINLTDQLCDKYKASCISNSNGTACQDKQNTCNLYNSTDGTSNDPLKCSLSKNEGLCYFNSESACQTITASDCSIIINQTNMTDQKCKQYNTACTSNKIGTACQITLRNCKDYTDEDSCALSVQDGYCYWYTDEERCMQIVAASECSLITGQNLTDEECKLYNSLCTSNRARTACQQQFDNCTNYKTEDSCVYANQQYFCVWDTSDTSCKKISSAAQCKLISYVPNITNSDCKMTLNECRINSDNTGCQEEKPTCSEYNTEIENCTSSAGKKCFKYTTDQTVSCLQISDPTSDCQKVTGTNLTYADCYSYGSGCSVNADKTQCQEVKTNCGDYQQQSECTKALQGYCYWLNSECVKITGEIQLSECLLVSGTNLKHEDCQRYHVDCTSNKAGSSCVELKQDCSSYLTSDECTQTLQNRCFFADSTCLPITQGTDCPSIVDPSKLLTYDICQFYHTSCSVNFDGSACVEIKANCSDYDSTQCYKSSQSECIVNLEGQTSTCIDKSTASNCSSIGINEYTHENCQAIKSDCTINATNDGCTEITCLNYIYTNFDHENCNEWLSECTVNADNDGCIKMPSDCISQTTPCIQSELGRCALINDICTLRTCLQTTQDANFDSDQECSDYLQTCTIANIGGCQSRRSCNQYTTQSTCVLDTQDNKCFWNPTDKNCVDLLCENIEQSSQFNTHDKCYAIDNQTLKCTIRELNGQIAQGCKSRGDCNSYLIKEQCVIDKNDKTCVWNTNLTIPACVLKACNTAVLTITTHTECLNYYSDNQVSCTVHAKLNTDQTISLAGCQQTVQCNQYIHKEQCQINQQGKSCGWDGTKCEIKSCYTAPPETDDDQKCKNYFDETCTVNDSGQGCRIIPDQCEGMTEKQCIKNKNGDPCFWDGSQCITKTCDNAPTTLLTALECNQYLEGCTIDEDVKCKVKPCEEFLYPTDELCKQAMSRCTSNGQYCVERGKCQDASQAGCILSKNNEQCEWVIGQQQSYCAIKSCETAPISLNTDSQCDNYYINCTTKLGGGCIKKSTCNAATVKEACITALDGTKCGWNEDSNQCQNKDCQHFNGTTHQICNQQNQSCTAGLKGKCAKMQECEQTFIKDACIIGLNGPCLWITNYQNLDGTSGACFKQGNCESFQWTTDEQCKLISDQCTTNGTQCVGITLCSETNINGGCKTGTDGQCIQSISSLNSTEQETCKLFTSCSDAYYLTHEQCQKANMNCTTNGLTGCMSLSKCSAYTNKLSCIKNDIGVIQNNNQVTSNGKCQWENETCRDQQCKDLIGLSHQSCQDQLYNCTSNGISCINQDKCALYNNEISCFKGTDGLCFWELATESNNNKGSCRIKKCSDLVDGKTFEQCQVIPQCISDGSVCIQKDKCSTYKTKTACNSGGTEGFCVFKQSTVQNAVIGVGTCSSMTQCTDASNDQVACLQASDRCQWIPNENKCSPHTCESYKSTNFICHSFYDWNKSKLTYCQQINGVCASYDPKTLKQNECFQISEYTYYWNTKSNSCSSCKNTNTTSNTTIIQNLQNTTQTTQGLIETIFILIILMIV